MFTWTNVHIEHKDEHQSGSKKMCTPVGNALGARCYSSDSIKVDLSIFPYSTFHLESIFKSLQCFNVQRTH